MEVKIKADKFFELQRKVYSKCKEFDKKNGSSECGLAISDYSESLMIRAGFYGKDSRKIRKSGVMIIPNPDKIAESHILEIKKRFNLPTTIEKIKADILNKTIDKDVGIKLIKERERQQRYVNGGKYGVELFLEELKISQLP